MSECIPNPLADETVKRDIDEKVATILYRNLRFHSYNDSLEEYLKRILKEAAERGMATGFRMGWRVYEVTKGGKQ